VRRSALIIGDSGVRTPADMCKLLALGADCVMVGSALAGTYEAPGRVIVVDGRKFKIMRGAASFSVQQEFAGEDPEYIEGAESIVAYKGRVADVIQRYVAGLRSSMSYMDARTLDEYRSNASFHPDAVVAFSGVSVPVRTEPVSRGVPIRESGPLPSSRSRLRRARSVRHQPRRASDHRPAL